MYLMYLTYLNTIQFLCVLSPHLWITFSWFVSTTYWNISTVAFRFRLSLWHTFITSQLDYLLVQRVTYFDHVRITLKYENCWNVCIVYERYLIKQSFLRYITFLSYQTFDNIGIFNNISNKYRNNVTITFHICSSEWQIL